MRATLRGGSTSRRTLTPSFVCRARVSARCALAKWRGTNANHSGSAGPPSSRTTTASPAGVRRTRPSSCFNQWVTLPERQARPTEEPFRSKEKENYDMTTAKLTRAAGVCALLAGVLFLLPQFIHPEDNVMTVTTTGWAAAHLVNM